MLLQCSMWVIVLSYFPSLEVLWAPGNGSVFVSEVFSVCYVIFSPPLSRTQFITWIYSILFIAGNPVSWCSMIYKPESASAITNFENIWLQRAPQGKMRYYEVAGASFALNKWVKLRVSEGRTLQLYSVWHTRNSMQSFVPLSIRLGLTDRAAD